MDGKKNKMSLLINQIVTKAIFKITQLFNVVSNNFTLQMNLIIFYVLYWF